jgi:hypothetical protein
MAQNKKRKALYPRMFDDDDNPSASNHDDYVIPIFKKEQ